MEKFILKFVSMMILFGFVLYGYITILNNIFHSDSGTFESLITIVTMTLGVTVGIFGGFISLKESWESR